MKAGTWVAIQILALIFVALLLIWSAASAFGHTHPGQYAQYGHDVQRWLRSQRVPGIGGLCCNEIDAEEVQVEIRNGEYWIQGTISSQTGYPTYYQRYRDLGRILGMDEKGWVKVPPETVLTDPNKAGHAVVWWGTKANPDNTLEYLLFIRCFAPGELY